MITLTAAQQALVKSDSTIKNFHVHFPNGEYADLDNSNIVHESVSFTESVCSDSVFRFGGAIASVVSFETVGIGNMLGMLIECSMEFINGADSVTIPYGTFTVDSCPRDHKSMQHRKVTAYSQTVADAVTEFERFKMRIPRFYTDVYTPNIMHMIGAFSNELLADFAKTTLTLPTFASGLSGIGLTDNRQIAPDVNKYLYMENTGQGIEYVLYFGINANTTVHTREVDPNAVYKVKLYKGAGYDTYLELKNQTVKEYGFVEIANALEYAKVTDWHATGLRNTSILGDNYFRYKDMGEYVEIAIYPYFCDPLNEYLELRVELGTWDMVLGDGYDQALDQLIQADLEVYSSIEVEKYTAPVSLMMSFNSTLQGMYRSVSTTATWEFPYVTFINAYSIRDIVEGSAELNASFGRCNRDGTLSLIRLDDSAPYALTADDVKGAAWWDEYNVNPIGSVMFKYTHENQEMTTSYKFGGGSSVYDMTNNEMLTKLVITIVPVSSLSDMTDIRYFYVYDGYLYLYNGSEWEQTLEYENESTVLQALLNTLFVPYADTVLFTPLDADFNGMPYLQAGDAITLTAADGTVINSYVLNHTFNGIQEITEDVNTVQGEVIG